MLHKLTITIFISGALFYTSLCDGYDDSPSCFRDLEKNFFDRDIVTQAMSLYRINTASWGPILRRLDQTTKNVPKEIKLRASKMQPNPLDHPFNPQESQNLLIQVLFETFARASIESQVESDNTIQEMFDYILRRQQHRLDACLVPESKKAIPQAK